MVSRDYEVMIIFRTGGTEAEMTQAVSQLEDPIKRFGGSMGSSTSWGRRRLTHRIARQQEGYYQLLTFKLPPSQLAEVKRAFQLNEGIVRFMILSRDERPKVAAAATATTAAATA